MSRRNFGAGIAYRSLLRQRKLRHRKCWFWLETFCSSFWDSLAPARMPPRSRNFRTVPSASSRRTCREARWTLPPGHLPICCPSAGARRSSLKTAPVRQPRSGPMRLRPRRQTATPCSSPPRRSWSIPRCNPPCPTTRSATLPLSAWWSNSRWRWSRIRRCRQTRCASWSPTPRRTIKPWPMARRGSAEFPTCSAKCLRGRRGSSCCTCRTGAAPGPPSISWPAPSRCCSIPASPPRARSMPAS